MAERYNIKERWPQMSSPRTVVRIQSHKNLIPRTSCMQGLVCHRRNTFGWAFVVMVWVVTHNVIYVPYLVHCSMNYTLAAAPRRSARLLLDLVLRFQISYRYNGAVLDS